MNICTIITPNWIDAHLTRWVRYVKTAMPDSRLHLFLAGGTECLAHPSVQAFDAVKIFKGKEKDRAWFNRVRMDACKIFGAASMLYIDADADVYEDLAVVEKECKVDLGFVRSPQMHDAWVNLSQELGWKIPKTEGNNGFLFMRKSFKKEYQRAETKIFIEKLELPERIRGTLIFNMMLRQAGKKVQELDPKWSVIWHDYERWLTAKCLQWCNKHGQAKRVKLEELWRVAQ